MSATSGQRAGRCDILGNADRSDGIDLSALAEGYRYRPLSNHAAELAEAAAAGLGVGDVALDIGGGTGMHAAAWKGTGLLPVVIDPSAAMLAAVPPGVAAIRAVGQRLPFRSGTCALAYFHLSIHYGDWRTSVAEAWRVLRRGGRLEIWTLGEDHHRQALIMRYFPQLLEVDLGRFPDPSDIAGWVGHLGGDATVRTSIEPKEMVAGRWEEAVRARFISTLQHLSDTEVEAGITRFRDDHPRPDAVVSYNLIFSRVAATR
jgi:SAM-dependent methyltransferase